MTMMTTTPTTQAMITISSLSDGVRSSEPDAAFTEPLVVRDVDAFPLCLVDSPLAPAALLDTDGVVVALLVAAGTNTIPLSCWKRTAEVTTDVESVAMFILRMYT